MLSPGSGNTVIKSKLISTNIDHQFKYICDLEYQYKINNYQLSDNVIQSNRFFSSESKHLTAKNEHYKYPADQIVTVYVNYFNSKKVFLEHNYGLYFIGSFILLFGFVLVIKPIINWFG